MSLIETQLANGVVISISSKFSVVHYRQIKKLIFSLSPTDFFSLIAETALITVVSSYIMTTIPFLMLVLYCLQHIYLRTSRQLRLLELESRSPLYSHFLETLEGLSTIRAFGWEHESSEVNARYLDDSQIPYYLLFCIQQWLALVLDFIVAAMAVMVVILATTLRYSTSPGLLGVSLNSVLSKTTKLGRHYANLEDCWLTCNNSVQFDPVEIRCRMDVAGDFSWCHR